MTTFNRTGHLILAGLLAAGFAACEADDDGSGDGGGIDTSPCDGKVDANCVEIQVGEQTFYRHLSEYDTTEIDDDGTLRSCISLTELITSDVTPTPQDYRYQIFGTDDYTFGGYATWTNMLNGYIEVVNRRIFWDPTQLLPNSWNVRDSYLIVLVPAGG